MVPIGFGLVTVAAAVCLFLLIFFIATAVLRWRRSQILIDINAVLADERLRGYILEKRERAARRRYRLLTGASLRETRRRVSELITNPELLDMVKKKRPDVEPAQAEGVRTLVAEERIEEAVEVYRQFMGVDKFTAEQAVLEMQREMRLSDVAIDDDPADIEAATRRQEKSQWE